MPMRYLSQNRGNECMSEWWRSSTPILVRANMGWKELSWFLWLLSYVYGCMGVCMGVWIIDRDGWR